MQRQNYSNAMERFSRQIEEENRANDQMHRTAGSSTSANEESISRLALQHYLQQSSATDVLGNSIQQQRQMLAAQQHLNSIQNQRLALQQQQLIQSLQQQQQQQQSLSSSLGPHSSLSHLLANPSLGLGLPANQVGLSGLSPFGPTSLAESRLLAPLQAANLARLPSSIGNIEETLQINAMLRSSAAARLLGDNSLGSSLGGAALPASLLQHHQQTEQRASGVLGGMNPLSPPSTLSVLDQYAKGAKEPPFPLKLHQILSNPEYQECICWLPHGKAWRILKPSAFEQIVIPHFFRHAKYASFMRQVNGWGFKRMIQGVEHNSYYHELFIRERPELCLKMKRTGTATGKPSTEKIDGPSSPEKAPGAGGDLDTSKAIKGAKMDSPDGLDRKNSANR